MTVTDSTPADATPEVVEHDPQVEAEATEELVEDELLVEEISIDGMCGVY